MRIDVRLNSGLAAKVGQTRLALELTDGATPASVLAQLQAAYPAAGELLAQVVCVRQGLHIGMEEPLQDGQELALLIPIAGGTCRPVQTTPTTFGET